MSTSSPFSWLEQALPAGLSRLQPPAWVVDEILNRLVLLLNHMLMAEPEAVSRLLRQQGRSIEWNWQHMKLQLRVTPAGLLERSALDRVDLSLSVLEPSPLALAAMALRGEKPRLRIEGDVQLAAEVNWLIDHVRWDLEEDLSRLIGDAPAHALGRAVQQAVLALRSWVGRRAGASDAATVAGAAA